MAQDASSRLLSYEDYAAIDDGCRYEVIDGELVMTPSPRLSHQRIVLALGHALDEFALATNLGEVAIAPFDVVLRAERPAVVVQPDVLFVSKERASIVSESSIQGPPDIAVEVLSPSSIRLDSIAKRRLYARYAVPEYWIVSIDAEQIAVHTLSADGQYGKPTLYEPGDSLETPRLPGFALDVAALFARTAPA